VAAESVPPAADGLAADAEGACGIGQRHPRGDGVDDALPQRLLGFGRQRACILKLHAAQHRKYVA